VCVCVPMAKSFFLIRVLSTQTDADTDAHADADTDIDRQTDTHSTLSTLNPARQAQHV